MNNKRLDGRLPDELRELRIVPGVSPYAEGSAEVNFGKTKLLVTASIEQEIPSWMPQGSGGWITAEYGMLPRSTHTRNKREAASGKQGGRTLEIQRLIGRSLRAAVDLSCLGPITIRCDCDVLCADGGTRAAAICGGWVALYEAVSWAVRQGLAPAQTRLMHVAAVSVGVVRGTACLDLCYEEDSQAEFDLNLVFTESFELVEIQGTGEKKTLALDSLRELIELGKRGAERIIAEQKEVIRPLGKASEAVAR